MNDLLTIILQNITTKPDGVNISMEMEGDVEVYTIKVDPEDVGRVIGKSGKIIRAIRSLAHVSAVHNQKRVRIHLDDGSPQEQAAPQDTINEAVQDVPAVEVPAVDTPTPEAPAEMPEPATETTPVVEEVVEAPEVEASVEVEVPAETPETPEAPVEVEAPKVEDLLPEEPAK